MGTACGKGTDLKTILFVCSGNTCRSPLAEGLAKKILSDHKGKIAHISSAGTSAVDGFPASSLAVEIAKANSVDISGHKARLLNAAMIREADLIVAMASRHRDAVGSIDPSALDHTFLITDFCDDEDGDILDPIGLGLELYKKTFRLIEKCIVQLGDKLDSFDGWKKEGQTGHVGEDSEFDVRKGSNGPRKNR